MRRMTICLLGPFAVTVDGAPVTGFAYAKVRALLAYLALERQRSHTRSELATLLWPDQSERAARGSLSNALTTLRNALGDKSAARPVLLSDVQTVQLDPDCTVELDVTQFRAVLRKSEAHAHRSWRTCGGCAERLREALSLYRGEFLADLSIPDSALFEEWAALHREQLVQHALTVLERLVERAQWRGADAEASAHAQRLVAMEPLLEAHQRACMRLLALNGETAAALARYRQLKALLARELAVEPEDATTALYDQIRRGDTASLQLPHSPFVVPLPPTPLVGRVDERRVVCTRLQDGNGRLLTITGAGGIGKTRLAIEAAHALRYDVEDGIYMVELAPLNDASLMADTIARVLGVQERPRHSIGETLQEHLRHKQLLLILDNFEHVVAAAPLVSELLAGCPALRVLVTSRVPLQIRAEQQYILEPLDAAAAVQLFVGRAHAAGAALAADAVTTALYPAICRRLDCLPLAIELIAVRARTRSPRELLLQLEQPLEATARGPHDAPARHQSLRHAIQWSYDLLDAEHQRVFRHLGVFAGGCSAEAANAVTGSTSDVLPLLETLVQVSLLQQQLGADETRFMMLETIGEYALEQLALCGEAATARHLHADYYVDLVARADAKFKTREQPVWGERLDREHANVLAALTWCSAAGRFETGLRLSAMHHWIARGRNSLGLRWVDRLLAQAAESVPPDARVAAMNAGGFMSFSHGDYPQARARYEQSLHLAQRADDHAGSAVALNGLGMALWRLGDVAQARGVLEQSVALCRETGNRFELGRAYTYLGSVQHVAGRVADARECFERALPIAHEIGHVTLAGVVLMHLAGLATQTGDYAGARARYGESLAAHRELRNVRRIAETLVHMAAFHTQQGELEAALACYADAEQHYRAINNQADLGSLQLGRGDIAFYQGDYATARDSYQRALDLFRAAGDQQHIGRALGALGYTAVREGQLNEAAGVCTEALLLRRAIGHRPGMIVSLESGAIELALALGRPVVAARLRGAAEAARAELDLPRSPIDERAADLVETSLRAQLGDANFELVANEGRVLSLEQAAAYALDSLAPGSIDRPLPELRIFALGPVRVFRGDRLLTPANWTYAKARELVLYLLFHQQATREQIGAELWPDASTAHVRQRFSAALAHARNALGRDTEWISLAGGHYRFNRAQPVWVDVDAFEAGLFEARLLQTGTHAERAAAVLSDAVVLYSNDFAGDVHDGEWHVARRTALRQAWLEGLLELGRLHGTAGRNEQAIATLQRAVDADVYYEAAHQELIRAYARAGKHRQAVAQYQHLTSALAKLRAEPAPETLALIVTLRSSEPL